MSNSLSPGSDLVIDDEDLELTMEDLSKAEAECLAGPSGGQVLARPTVPAKPSTQPKPINQVTFTFGATSSNITNIPLEKSRVSPADPRTKFKPSRSGSGLLNLNPGGSATNNFSFTKNHNNGFEGSFNLVRTVNNNSGSSSFSSQDQRMPQGQGQNKFVFGSSSPSTLTLPDSSITPLQIVAPTFSPPHSPSTIADADSQGEDLSKYILMKQRHEAKMRTEKLKMEKIEKLIELKKQKQESQQKFWIDNSPSYDPEIRAKQMELIKEELELKKQTTRMLQMQQDMMMKNNAEEERRRLEEKKGMLELQMQVKNLEMMLSNKQEPVGSGIDQFCKKPISYGLGSIKNRLGPRQQNPARGGRNVAGLAGDQRYDRKRIRGEKRTEASRKCMDEGVEIKKRKKYWNAKLPDDLVLTEITDQGPMKVDSKKKSDDYGYLVSEDEEGYEEDLDRYEYEGEMDPDLVLTEFGENGPVKAIPSSRSSPDEN